METLAEVEAKQSLDEKGQPVKQRPPSGTFDTMECQAIARGEVNLMGSSKTFIITMLMTWGIIIGSQRYMRPDVKVPNEDLQSIGLVNQQLLKDILRRLDAPSNEGIRRTDR